MPPQPPEQPHPNPQLQNAIDAWQQALGPPHVAVDPAALARYARTTAPGIPQSPAPHPGPDSGPGAILFPDSTAQVQDIVRIAAQYGVPVYPISRGKNWGYGDANPPTPGQVIVDLQRMNRIIEVNPELAYAVIEPGVTQQQLSDYLTQHGHDLWMDSTGAGPQASLVGNTLDRGFGHTRYGDHFLNTCGMEVVLADGRILNTGFGHYPNAQAHRVYRYGVGPFLDGLFGQSNFGIVTQIGLWLMPKPEAFCAYFFSAPNDADLADLVDHLAKLRLAGLLQSTLHIANDLRAVSARTRYPWDLTGGQTPLPRAVRLKLRQQYGLGAWNGIGAVYGTAESVRVVKQAVRQALRGYRVKFLDDRRLSHAKRLRSLLGKIGLGRGLGELIDLVEPVYGLLKGVPSDEPLAGVSWRVRDAGPPKPIDPLDQHAGLMWVSPVLPTSGQAAQEVVTLIEPIYKKHGFEPLVTFTMITDRAMVCVSNLSFDQRQPQETRSAQACYDELMAALIANGYIPYRTGPGGYAKLVGEGSVFWSVAGQLKAMLDPHGIIAPGRYLPGGSFGGV